METGEYEILTELVTEKIEAERAIQTWRITAQGRGLLRLEAPPGSFPGLNSTKTVVASICELANGKPHPGSAVMQLFNVVPFDDGALQVYVSINWDRPLTFAINLLFDA